MTSKDFDLFRELRERDVQREKDQREAMQREREYDREKSKFYNEMKQKELENQKEMNKQQYEFELEKKQYEEDKNKERLEVEKRNIKEAKEKELSELKEAKKKELDKQEKKYDEMLNKIEEEKTLKKKNKSDEKERKRIQKEYDDREKKIKEQIMKFEKQKKEGKMSLFTPVFMTIIMFILISVIIIADNDDDLKKKITFGMDNLSVYANILVIIVLIVIFTWKMWFKSNHPEFFKNVDFVDKLLIGSIPIIIFINIMYQFKDKIDLTNFITDEDSPFKYLSLLIIVATYYGLYKVNIITDQKMLIILCIITVLFTLIMLNFKYIKSLNNQYLINGPESLNYVFPLIMFSIFGTLHYKNKVSLFSSVVGCFISTLLILIFFNMKRINSLLTPSQLADSNEDDSDTVYDDSKINQEYKKYYFDVIYDDKINYIPIIITITIYVIIMIIGQVKFFK